jgi:2-(3-amino-3-carboxypropyl)histidine synthase
MPSIQVDVEAVSGEVRRRGARLVALQLPEGLKRRALGLVEALEGATGATVVVSADPCYGACDLVDRQLEGLGVDIVVHVGHTEMGDTTPVIPTLFVEARIDLDVTRAVRAALPLLPEGGRVGLLTTAQHRHALDAAVSVLHGASITPVLGKGGRRLAFMGQVLGCDLSAARVVAGDVDAFLLLGGGTFHAVGVALATGKPVVVADVELGEARPVEDERDRVLRRRSAVMASARDAGSFGIIVESRPGQQRWELARKLRDELAAAGRRPVLMLLREVSPERLAAMGLDAYVSTACPRIAVDDQSMYPVPVLTPHEVRVLLENEPWEGYRLDEIG